MASTRSRKSSPPPPLRKPATADHLLTQKKPIERHVPVVLVDIDYPFSPEDDDDSDHDAQEWTNYRKLVQENTVWCTFRSIGRKAYDALVDDCPPTKDELKEAKEKKQPAPTYSPKSFVPRLVHASLVVPEMSLEQVQVLFDGEKYGEGELLTLWQTALEVNTSRRTAPLGKGFGPTAV